MNLKKFGIISEIFIAIIIVLSIVLSCVTTTTSMEMADPATITVYDHNVLGTTYSKENTPTKYKNLLNEIRNIGKMSVLTRAINKVELHDTISQDINGDFANWAGDSNLKNNICIELKFNETQSQIVYVDGDSKQIDYKQLIFILPEDGKVQEMAIYFMISSGANYSASPMLMTVNCKNLFNYINDNLLEKVEE